MGYYEDHMEAVANRRAKNLKKHDEKWERQVLIHYRGWSKQEAYRIIKREKEILLSESKRIKS